MNIQLLRIDDRLIHGQVVLGWVNSLNSRRIVLCDNSVAENEWEKELYLSVVPDPLDALVFSVKELADVIVSEKIDLSKTIVLISEPETAEELLGYGADIKKINLGGIHYREGRKQLLPYLYLDPEEAESCRHLIDKGVVLECQDVPEAKRIPLQNLLAKMV